MLGDEELYSQRQGRARRLDDDDFADLVWRQLAELRREGYFDEALGPLYDPRRGHPGGRLTENDFLRRLGKPDVYEAAVELGTPYGIGTPYSCRRSSDVLFDVLELFHRDALASGDRRETQSAFRARVNPDLALYTPPMELLASGQIVAKAPADLEPLLDEPIADRRPLAGA